MRQSPVRTLLLALLLVGPGALGAAAQEKPRYGGVLHWYAYADPGRLDIHTESPLVVQQVTAGIYSGLLHYDPDEPTRVTGDLAERWTGSPDGKTYTFHLRKGVKWHDGQPFSAADVKATFDRILNPEFKSPRCGSMLKPMVAAVEAVDPHTVLFRLKFPAAPFIPAVASAWCRVVAKHILDKYGDLTRPEAQIGTGPFKFKRYERDSVIDWEKNRDYFIAGLPYLDGVKQFILKGGATQLAAAKTGRILLWNNAPPMKKSEADELQRARGDEVEIYQASMSTLFFIFLHTQKPPFNHPDIRRAAHLAIDRQEVVAKALEGAGVPCVLLDPRVAGDFALPLDEINTLPGCRQPKDQDIAEARRLVEKHYPNGVDIEAAVRSVGRNPDQAQLVLAQLRKIGIRGALKTYEGAAGFTVYGKGDFTLIGSQDRGMVSGDPGDVFALVYTTEAGSNWGKWSDRKVDELAERGLKETNRERRKQIYHELQRHLLTQDSPAISVGMDRGWFFRDKRVRNYKTSATIYDHGTFMKVWLGP